MKLKTLSIFVVIVTLGAALLHIANDVREARLEVRKLKAELTAEQEAHRVLKAEWAYLNAPARLEKLAGDYLEIGTPETAQMNAQAQFLPTHEEAIMHDVAASSKVMVKPVQKPVRRAQVKSFDALMQEVTP